MMTTNDCSQCEDTSQQDKLFMSIAKKRKNTLIRAVRVRYFMQALANNKPVEEAVQVQEEAAAVVQANLSTKSQAKSVKVVGGILTEVDGNEVTLPKMPPLKAMPQDKMSQSRLKAALAKIDRSALPEDLADALEALDEHDLGCCHRRH